MLKIGITGGIGSGKTTICNIFNMLGIPIYFADPRAKELMITDQYLISNIKKLFGEDSYNSNNTLNRTFIADIIFNNRKKLEALNSLVHPAVKRDFEQWCLSQKSLYIIKEAALLFESGSFKDLDKTILVTAPLEIRIKRVLKRDNISREKILARVKNQMADNKKEQLADYIIKNDEKAPLIGQILELHQQLLKEANEKIR